MRSGIAKINMPSICEYGYGKCSVDGVYKLIVGDKEIHDAVANVSQSNKGQFARFSILK